MSVRANEKHRRLSEMTRIAMLKTLLTLLAHICRHHDTSGSALDRQQRVDAEMGPEQRAYDTTPGVTPGVTPWATGATEMPDYFGSSIVGSRIIRISRSA